MRRVVGRHGAGATEIGMRIVDAGVDHGNLDVLAVQAEVLPHAGRADQRDAVRVGRAHHLQRPHGDDAGQRRELCRLVARDPNLDAVVRRLVRVDDGATQRLDLALERILRALERVLGCVFFGLRELPAGGFLLDGHRIAAELHHNIYGVLAETDRRPCGRDQGRAIGHGLRAHGAGVRRRERTEHHCHCGKRTSRFESHEFSLH